MSGAQQLEEAIAELIEATEALANSRLVERVEGGWYGAAEPLPKRAEYCRECFRAGLNGGTIEHGFSCVVGQAVWAAKVLRDEMSACAMAEASSSGCAKGLAPLGILGAWPKPIEPVSAGVEANFIAGSPVRKIVYDVAAVDLCGNGLGEGLGAETTHEEAASQHGEVFGEAAK